MSDDKPTGLITLESFMRAVNAAFGPLAPPDPTPRPLQPRLTNLRDQPRRRPVGGFSGLPGGDA